MSPQYSNGALPDSALSDIAAGRLAKGDYCAASWNAMNVEARKLGCELRPTGSKSSYRTYAQQVYLYHEYQAGRGSLAAVPGSSNHGWGLAVDLATHEMRSMVDRIGATFGWQKQWSDAQSEWWHIRYRAGIWSGPDPGAFGEGVTPIPFPDLPKDTEMIAVGTMSDGRFELFVEDKNGNIWHAWQAKDGGWAGAEAGKRNAGWYSLGTPGKK